jgi:hypothetical protein
MENVMQERSRLRSRPVKGNLSNRWSRLSLQQLRSLCNETYELLNHDNAGAEVRERYDYLLEELERRKSSAATSPVKITGGCGGFRDNRLFSRFELYRNGIMAGYVEYEMRNGNALLLHAAVDRRFQEMDLEELLMRSVFFDVHRRRISLTPYCLLAQEFLRKNPRFLSLLRPGQQRHFKDLIFADSASPDA